MKTPIAAADPRIGIEPSTIPAIVVMGVSGSGKSTVGTLVADALGVPFVDADVLHPAANVAKMAAGIPLTDRDRWPWLERVGQTLVTGLAAGDGVVIACSALRRVYRDVIWSEAADAVFLHLAGTRDVIARRLDSRAGHFMPAALLDSQFLALEPIRPDECGVVIDIDAPVEDVVASAVAGIHSMAAVS